MTKKGQIILTTSILFGTFCASVLINTNVFAGIFPVTPPITPPSPTATGTPRPTPVTPPVTPTATPTFSPRPTVTPTMTIKPTITPKPTPVTPPVTPKPNSFPVIVTNKLALGKINKFYIMSITGKDSDRKDNLRLSVTNLPSGIKLITCIPYTNFSENYVSCIYSGTPNVAGTYPLRVTLTDGKIGAIKVLNLKITK